VQILVAVFIVIVGNVLVAIALVAVKIALDKRSITPV